MNTRVNKLAGLAAVVSVVFVGSELAQAAESLPLQIEEVVVVAQKRQESLQEVPVTITALSADDLAKGGIESTLELATVTPSLNIAQQASAAITFIRGIGTNTATIGNEASVATYVDEVYFANATLAKFNNIEQVEVLKGPQGTLFGRNATGGLIHIITKDPTQETQVKLKVGYGNYDTVTGSLYAATGISDYLAADLAVYFKDQGEGFIDNSFLGGEHQPEEDLSFRTKWLITPNENVDIRLTAYDVSNEGSASMARQVREGGIGFVGTVFSGDFFDIPVNRNARWEVDRQGVSANIKFRTDLLEFTSITAYNDDESSFLLDQDASTLDILTIDAAISSESFSQEFRVASLGDGDFSWLLGLYYYENESGNVPTSILQGPALAPALALENHQETKSYAVFAEGHLQLTDQFGFTVGLRYSRDEIEASNATILGGGALSVPSSADKNFDEPTWRVVADYHLAEQQLLYASYSRGYKAGLFNLVGTTSPPFMLPAPAEPEIVDAYEIGYKSQWMDNRLRINAAAFYYDYQDIQVTTAVATGSITSNAAAATIIGAEIDVLFLATERLDLKLGLSLLDTEYDRFPNGLGRTPALGGGNMDVFSDLSGNSLPRTPDYTVHAGANYSIPTDIGQFGATVTYYYNDGFFWEADNRLTEDSYHLINAELSWLSLDERYRLSLWGKNLADEEYSVYTISNNMAGDLEAPASPLTFGVSAEVSF